MTKKDIGGEQLDMFASDPEPLAIPRRSPRPVKKAKVFGGQQSPMFMPTSLWIPPTELPDLRRIPRIALDRETRDMGLTQKKGPGWAYYGSMLGGCVTGISVAWRDEAGGLKSFYAPIEHPDTPGCFTREQIGQWERDHQAAGVRFVMQNANYDVAWGLVDLGVPIPEKIDDSICASYMVDEGRLSYSLDELCKWRGLPGKDEKLLREAAATFGVDPKNEMWRLPARYVGPYAETDAIRTLELMESLEPELDKQDVRNAYELEMALLPMVCEMRRRGIRVDLEAAEQAKEKFKEQSAQALKEFGNIIGHTVGIDNLRSNKFLDQVFTAHKVPFPRDKAGRGSFDSKWLKNHAWDHPLTKLYVRAKTREDAAEKFIDTYIIGFAHRGRLHASINQVRSEEGGTRTYRFSYQDPPLQQIPHSDEELAEEIRGVFIPEEGERWFKADFSQQELRLIVHFAERLGLRKATEAANKYRNDPKTDFHQMVADMTGLDRRSAKNASFAKSYSAGVAKFASMINRSENEARDIMEQYDREMPFTNDLAMRCQSKAEKTGFIKLLDGARVHWESWEPAYLSKEEKDRGWGSGGAVKMGDCSKEEADRRVADETHPWYGKRLKRAKCRKAMNALIQGSAARQTKIVMRDVWRAGFVPLLQLHDELDFSLKTKQQGEQISEIMQNSVKLNVPMLVDGAWGANWGDAVHEWKDVG